MDKNKSAFKLNGLPHIYWINLDRATDRRSFMEMQFKYWGIENHTRISAYDGADEAEDDVTQYLKGKFPDRMLQTELACCMSHLKEIKHWYDTTDEDYCIIAEDDVNLDIARYWPFTWKEFFALLPDEVNKKIHRLMNKVEKEELRLSKLVRKNANIQTTVNFNIELDVTETDDIEEVIRQKIDNGDLQILSNMKTFVDRDDYEGDYINVIDEDVSDVSISEVL